jgi:hypothetical protein
VTDFDRRSHGQAGDGSRLALRSAKTPSPPAERSTQVGTVKHEKVEQVDGKKGKEWKVTFKNPAATNKDQQTLYVFMSLPGNVLAANLGVSGISCLRRLG